MNAQSAGAVNVETESASGKTGEENKGQSNPSLVDALLKDAREMGHIIGDPVRTQTQVAEPAAEESESEETEETQVESESETQVESEAGAETETEETPEESEHKGIQAQIDELTAQGKEVPWYFPRIIKVTRQKNENKALAEKREGERNLALEENKRLQGELDAVRNQPPAAAANSADPLSGVWNESDIQNLTRECNRWIVWATENPHGGEVVLGKDGDEELTRELDSKQAVQLKLAAEQMLREGIPGRRQFLQARYEGDHTAIEIYPELKDSNSLFTREINQYLRDYGNLPLNAIPDIKIWLGHAITRRNQFVAEKNGKAKSKSSTNKIVESARTKVAPPVARTRGFLPRVQSADLESARKDLQEKGTAESAEKWLEAQQKNRSKQVERVQ